MPIELASLPPWLNTLVFAASAGAIWVAVIGLLLLGGVTTLPEIVVAGTAAVHGNASLAINNLLGSVAAQIAILAGADLIVRRGALTTVVPNPVVLLQGTLGILLVTAVAIAIMVGDLGFLGAGVWSWFLFGVFIYAVKLTIESEANTSWQVIGTRRPQPSVRTIPGWSARPVTSHSQPSSPGVSFW